jgi:hypothetical protein
LNDINGLPPPLLFDKLRSDLPSEETRQYVVKVTGYRKEFVSAPSPGTPALAPPAAPGGASPVTAAAQAAKKSS